MHRRLARHHSGHLSSAAVPHTHRPSSCFQPFCHHPRAHQSSPVAQRLFCPWACPTAHVQEPGGLSSGAATLHSRVSLGLMGVPVAPQHGAPCPTYLHPRHLHAALWHGAAPGGARGGARGDKGWGQGAGEGKGHRQGGQGTGKGARGPSRAAVGPPPGLGIGRAGTVGLRLGAPRSPRGRGHPKPPTSGTGRGRPPR